MFLNHLNPRIQVRRNVAFILICILLPICPSFTTDLISLITVSQNAYNWTNDPSRIPGHSIQDSLRILVIFMVF